jgi:acetyl esterase/lipase
MIKSVQQSYGFLIKKIEELKNSINNIILSGHSLGAGVAQLIYIYLY